MWEYNAAASSSKVDNIIYVSLKTRIRCEYYYVIQKNNNYNEVNLNTWCLYHEGVFAMISDLYMYCFATKSLT